MSEHETFQDAAGAFVLGALPDAERAAYVLHLETCMTCRAEVDELTLAVDALPVSPPAMRPPPALKARIMAEVEREAALLASAGEPDRRPAKARRSWRERFALPIPGVAALASAALLLGFGGGAVLFATDDGRTIDFQTAGAAQNASAELEMTDGKAIIVANGLPAPPNGQVYQVWIQRPGHSPEPTSALFTPRRDGSATASVTGDMDGVETVIVNTEPDGGSTTPTSDPVLTASLS